MELFQQAADFRDVPYGSTRQVGTYLFHNSGNPKQIIVLFNGAIHPEKVCLSPIFQRSSWSEYFSHPTLVVHDPLIGADGDLRLSWYVGTASGWCFAELAKDFTTRLRSVYPDAGLVCLGSSGGGFAALMAALRGFCDLAIVNNPQTDILRYHAGLAHPFLKSFGKSLRNLLPQDKIRLSALETLQISDTNSKILYFQNLSDAHHMRNHFLPFMEAVYRSGRLRPEQLVAQTYLDSFAGHHPLETPVFLSMIKSHYPGLLSDKGKALARNAMITFRERGSD